MDPLDHLAGPAADLLDRVDDVLAESGAPATHRIWPLLRRVRALPAEAVAALAALHPEPLAAAAAAVRALIPRYETVGELLTAAVDWEGAAAEAFFARRDALAAHLTDGPTSMLDRLEAGADYLDDLAGWVSSGRAALARTLAEVLVSAEAVTLVVGDGIDGGPSVPAAAAEIGARVLAPVAELHDRGEALRRQWAQRLDESIYRSSADVGVRFDGPSRITL
ncbi:MAG TPA: hypothetical protein VF174_08495 [Micromonosporaceae bacterium]